MARSRRRRLPEAPVTAVVADLAHDGRGVARVEGKAVFVDGALPGETVQFRYTACHSKHDEARVEAVLEASPERVEPRCRHFGVCGGCSLQHLDAHQQLRRKQDWLRDNLQRVGGLQPQTWFEPLTGPHWGYRHKARLGVKHVIKKGKVLVGFRERNAPYLADLTRCEVLHPRVGTLLPELSELIQGLSIHDRLPQIEVAVGDDVVALSFRVLDPPSEADRAALAAFGERHAIQIYLQPKGPDTTVALWPAEPVLDYRLPELDLTLQFQPYHFTQVNPAINRRMVSRALKLLAPEPHHRVLDLYCGLGNFSLALARRAGQVVGVEGEPALVARAAANASLNRVHNAEFVAADLAKPVAGQPWADTRYDRVLLDPPRSGALEMIPVVAGLGAERVLYVSCHPATLARDAGELVHTHGYRLLGAGVMDMFPHTAHVESMALFGR